MGHATARVSVTPRPAPVRVASPIAIPVVGAPIKGRHLVRAPWAEPLSAFAGVIVETQQVPDAWFRPRGAAGRVMEPPIPAAQPSSAPRPLVAIPIVPDRPVAGPVPERAPVTTVPVRVVPVMAGARDAAARPAIAPVRPAPVLTSLGTVPTSIPRTAAAPIEPVVPLATPVTPAAARRGMLGRAVKLTVGFVVSLVAYEAAARIGRR